MITTETIEISETEAGDPAALSTVGAVVIGRNEGERLHRCLGALIGSVAHVVYVDSGSTDGSCELAKQLGVQVLPLDLSIPFTAARARNEGIEALLAEAPETEYVQVVDGDCSVADGWIECALETLTANTDAAIACGRRRERYPEATQYNRLCDMEWDGPAGDVIACGGDSMIRISAFREVGGFNPSLIAGEEPEMCFRLRHKGWRIVRADHDMTWHDAAMTRFGQWWKRAVRSGHAYAESNALHGAAPEPFRQREVRSIILWGGFVPGVAVLGAIPTLGISLLVALAGYFRLYRRIRGHRQQCGDAAEFARLYARFTVIGKLPQFFGLMRYRVNRISPKTLNTD